MLSLRYTLTRVACLLVYNVFTSATQSSTLFCYSAHTVTRVCCGYRAAGFVSRIELCRERLNAYCNVYLRRIGTTQCKPWSWRRDCSAQFSAASLLAKTGDADQIVGCRLLSNVEVDLDLVCSVLCHSRRPSFKSGQ